MEVIHARPVTASRGRPQTGRKENKMIPNSKSEITKLSEISESMKDETYNMYMRNEQFEVIEKNFGEDQSELHKLIIEENKKVELDQVHKERLRSIHLLEDKKQDEIYNWKSLFNKSRPVSSYTDTKKSVVQSALNDLKDREFISENVSIREDSGHLSKSNTVMLNSRTGDFREEATSILKVGKKDNFVFPIILIDEEEEKIKDFIKIPKNISVKRKKMEEANKQNFSKTASSFKINKSSALATKYDEITLSKSNSNYKIDMHLSISSATGRRAKNYANGNAIRPQSVFTRRKDNDVFYMSQAFSDYFKMDFKEFAEKFSLLHPKIRCDKKKLIQAMEQIKKDEEANLDKMDRDKEEPEIIIEQKHLNLAGNSKNIMPLLKSIYKQMYPPELQGALQLVSTKNYFNSNKPIGNGNIKEIDFKQNMRGNRMEEIRLPKPRQDYLEDEEDNGPETYDENDPRLEIFKDVPKVYSEAEEYDENYAEAVNNIQSKPDTNSDDIHIISERTEPPILSHESQLENIELVKEGTFERLDSKEDLMNMVEYELNMSYHGTRSSAKTERPKTALQNVHKKRSNKDVKKCYNTNNQIFNNETINSMVKSGNDDTVEGEDKGVQIKSLKDHFPEFSDNNKNRTLQSARKLPTKEKPITHPYSYQIMKSGMKVNSNNNTNSIFDDAIKIENVHTNIKKQFKEEAAKIDKRPQTSNNFYTSRIPATNKPEIDKVNEAAIIRPTTSRQERAVKMQYSNSLKKVTIQASRLNNVYFNDYIDMQFKPTNTGNLFNTKGKNDKNKQKLTLNDIQVKNGNLVIQKGGLSDLMIVQSLGENKNVKKVPKSARLLVNC